MYIKIKVKSVLVVNVERGSHVTPGRSADRQVNVASDNPLKQQWPRKKNHQDKKKRKFMYVHEASPKALKRESCA